MRLKINCIEEACPTCEPPRTVWLVLYPALSHWAPQEQNKGWMGFPHVELLLTTLLWGVKVPWAASMIAGSDTACGVVLTSFVPWLFFSQFWLLPGTVSAEPQFVSMPAECFQSVNGGCWAYVHLLYSTSQTPKIEMLIFFLALCISLNSGGFCTFVTFFYCITVQISDWMLSISYSIKNHNGTLL